MSTLDITQEHIDRALLVRNRGVISASQCPIGQAISERHDTYEVRVDENGIVVNGLPLYRVTNRMRKFIGKFDTMKRATPTRFRLLRTYFKVVR